MSQFTREAACRFAVDLLLYSGNGGLAKETVVSIMASGPRSYSALRPNSTEYLSTALRQMVSLYLLRIKQIRLFEATRGDLLTELRCLGYILETAMSITPNLTSDKTGSQSEESGELVDDPQATVPICISVTKEVWRNCSDC